MTGKSPKERQVLDTQAAILTDMLENAGYTCIEPDILQPAEVFLDRSGEDIRLRTYVFSDPAGNELCLRPDITVPVCRYHMEHADDVSAEARYSYHGPAFRFQRDGISRLTPREFEQAGVENFGAGDRERAEAETLALAMEAVRAAGLESFTVRVGDLGLFDAMLAGIEMPNRWRERLHHQFWRPEAFRNLLQHLSAPGGDGHEVADELSGKDEAEAIGLVRARLDERRIPLIGRRDIEEIAQRLHERAADRISEPLTGEMVGKIEAYLAVTGSPSEAHAAISGLELPGAAIERSLDMFARRFVLLSEAGVDTSTFRFSAEFGRNLEYYTGHVFQIEASGERDGTIVVGGGRYDRLLSDLGSEKPVPAVGFAIHSERLAAVVRERTDD